jgi:deoxycytidylate deaminase
MDLLTNILDTIPYQRTKHSSLKHSHVAMLYKRGKVLAIGINKVGSRSRGCGWNKMSIHAEMMAIKDIGDTSKLRGASMLVVRINSADEFVNSKPCDHCTHVLEKCIRQYGLNKVYYS